MVDLARLERMEDCRWRLPASGRMRVPGELFGDAGLLRAMDDKVLEQLANVATLPGIVEAAWAMPDAHWGYGFPIGGVAAFDPEDDGVVSAGGVGFDISCGVRLLTTGLSAETVHAQRDRLADALFAQVPAGVGSTGAIQLDDAGMDDMLGGGARWAVSRGYGRPADLERIEEGGCMAGADPASVSPQARRRQKNEMGTLGSGNHYLEVQQVSRVTAPDAASAMGLHPGDAVVSIHCGSRGLGHQIGTEFLRRMVAEAPAHGLSLPDRELACAPLDSVLGREYLGAMRAGINCALANRQIITALARDVFTSLWPRADLDLVYDVSHNTCKAETHDIHGRRRRLFVHRKGATRALGPGHPDLPAALSGVGQPVLVGGTMGTGSWVLAGTGTGEALCLASACHGAGRAMSRHQARRRWGGRQVVDELSGRGIAVRSPSLRGVAEEAPGAYKDVDSVVEATEAAGLARRVARLEPIVCIKG